MIYWPTKHPSAEIDYGADWRPTLAELGDPTITVSVWTILDGDVDILAQSIDDDSRGTICRVAGGTDGTSATLLNTVTLSDGQVLTEKAYVKIRS